MRKARRLALRRQLHGVAKRHPNKFHAAHGGIQVAYHVAEFSQGHSFTAYLGGLIAILMVYGFMWKGEIL